MKTTKKAEAEKIGWRLKDTRFLFESPWYDLRQDTLTLPDNTQFTYTYIEHPGSVFVVPVTRNREIILIRSYRYTVDEWCWEIPAGHLGDQSGCSPEQVARKELEEEIGAHCKDLELLGNFYLANGIGNITGYFYLAKDVAINQSQQLEASEVIDQILPVPVEQVRPMVSEGVINDSESAFAILLALERLRERQEDELL